MDVILLKDVADLGGKGDIVEVSNGYARNYLLPKKLAMKATDGAIKQADKLRQLRIEAEARAKDEAEELARNLVGSRVVIAARSGDDQQGPLGVLHGGCLLVIELNGGRAHEGTDSTRWA